MGPRSPRHGRAWSALNSHRGTAGFLFPGKTCNVEMSSGPWQVHTRNSRWHGRARVFLCPRVRTREPAAEDHMRSGTGLSRSPAHVLIMLTRPGHVTHPDN